jgi:hyperosmotically inducible protein
MHSERILRILVLGLLGLLLVQTSGCQSYRDGESRTYGERTDDVSIRTSIKLRLIGAEDVRSIDVDTEVFKSVVTLTGTVRTDEQRQKVLAIAREVKGVERVVDQLEVVTE